MSPPDRQISDTGRNSREHGKALPPEFGRLSFAGRGMPGRSDLYYVHSYYAELGQETIGTTDYINPFSGALQKDNYYAVQAHPEKSSESGQQILTNFLAL
jgi:imidazoleglycerol phosphate synthase glutamine amidotransferase subunit HisH